MDHHRTAFSLMELLVVVTIIAMLASLLLPVIGSVRDSARTAVCASNLRQIGMAGVTYAGDNRGLSYPTSMTTYTWNGSNDSYNLKWSFDLLGEYLLINANRGASGSNLVREVYTCPQARSLLKITQWASSYGCNASVHPKLKAYSGGDLTDPNRQTSWKRLTLARIPRVAETISMMDTCLGNGANTTTGDITWSDASEMSDPNKQSLVADATLSGWNKNSDITASGPPRYRHQRNTRSPIGFVDGHVENWQFKQALVRNWSILP
jgi:prepilin-type N-terminal cleavage/methylation domain-containing protein/prepilin-type processing-associated H-X9-DG protein